MADNLQALLATLSSVEKKGNTKANLKGAIANLEDNNSFLSGGSSLDYDSMSMLSGTVGGGRSQASYKGSISGKGPPLRKPQRGNNNNNSNSVLSRKNLKKQQESMYHSAPLRRGGTGAGAGAGGSVGGSSSMSMTAGGNNHINFVNSDDVSVGSLGGFSVASSVTNMSSAYGISSTDGGTSVDVAGQLKSVSSTRTKPSVKKVHKELLDNMSSMTLKDQEDATASLVRDIVTSSKLLSAAGPGGHSKFNPKLEKHLQEFKEGYDSRYGKAVKLPRLTTLTDSTMAKKLADNALAGAPTEDELAMANDFVDKALHHTKKGQIYASIDSMVTRQNVEKTKAMARANKNRAARRNAPAATDDASASRVDGGDAESGADDADAADDDSGALSHDSDLYSDTDSDTASDMSEEEKRERAAKKLRRSRKLKAQRKAEAEKEARKEGAKAAMDADANKEMALQTLHMTYIKEDAEGNAVLDTNSSGFFDKMTALRKAEEARAVMRARMEEEEAEAERTQKERDEARKQESTLAAADADGGLDNVDAGANAGSPTTASPPSTTPSTPPANAGRRDSMRVQGRKQSVVLAKLEAAGGYGVSTGAITTGNTVSPGATGAGNTADIVGDGSTASIGSSLLKYGHERDIAADLMAVSAGKSSPGASSTGAGAATAGTEKGKKSPGKTAKGRKSPGLTTFQPPGGPLVIGTVNYGIPYGLGLKGSGLNRPMTMSDVEKFQQELTSPKKQPLVALVSGKAEKEEKERSRKQEEEKAEKARQRSVRVEGKVKSSLLSFLEEEEEDDDESVVESIAAASAEGSIASKTSSNAALAGVNNFHRKQATQSARVAAGVLTRYQERQEEYLQIKGEHEESERRHEPWMDEFKWALHDEIGLDIDAKFMQKKLAEKAIRLMMFYILEVQLKNAFTFLRDQTRRVANARLLGSAAMINRMGRGMIARQRCRVLMSMMRERVEAKRKKEKQAATFLRRMARIIARNFRLYVKMKIVKRNLRHRRCSTHMQRHVRGWLARIYTERLRNWVAWQNFNITKIQCSFRQHLARRRVVLFRKLVAVETLILEYEAAKEAVKDKHRSEGAHTTIKRYYRGYKARKNLAKLIYWSRFDKAITLQKHIRGHQGRVRAHALMKVKRAKEKRVFDAAACMQRYVRGVNARIIFAEKQLEKRKEVARKRLRKKQYLENAAVNAGKGAVLSAMRKMMPFRYILTWSKALRIQKFWRGHRVRRRVYLMIIRRKIAADNAYFFGKHIGATHFQRMFRGFRIRRGLVRELRISAAWKIQCFLRQFLARQKKTFHQVRRDAITTLSKNIFLMLRFRKNMRIKREEKVLLAPALVVQRCWRIALARVRVRRLKDRRRGDAERSGVTQLRMRYILGGIQLRILQESAKRDLGKVPFAACDEGCLAYGPIQSLFLHAVGPNARLGSADDLLSNKINNTSFTRFCMKVKGLTMKGRAADTAVQMQEIAAAADDNLKRDPAESARPSTSGDNAADGRPVSETAASRPGSRGPSRGRSSRGGAGGATGGGNGTGKGPGGAGGESFASPNMPSGPTYKSFSLLDAVMSKDVSTILTELECPRVCMNNTEVDMIASRAKAAGKGGSKEMTYMDFVTALGLLGESHYEGSEKWLEEREFKSLTKGVVISNAQQQEKDGDVSVADASSRSHASSGSDVDTDSDSDDDTDDEEEDESEEEEEGEEDDNESVANSAKHAKKSRKKKKKSRKNGRSDSATSNSDDDDVPLDSEMSAAMLEMKKHELQRSLEKAKGAGAMLDKGHSRDNAFAAASWRAKQLIWKLDELSARQPNKKMLMVLKVLDSCRSEPWFLAVSTWMEKEARARLAQYVRKISGIYYHMKSAVFRHIMRDRIAARAQLEVFTRKVTFTQKFCRRYIYRKRAEHLAQAVIVRYLPDQGHAYWYNPHTNLSSNTKPKILGKLDCLTIALPPPGLEYVVKCSNCLDNIGNMNCSECEDTYCRPCFNDLHCKGNRATHNYVSVPMCGYCKYQCGCRTCLTCMTSKPEPDSPQALLSESERGIFCDACFSHMHDENVHKFELQAEDVKRGAKDLFTKTREAYLIQHQLQVRLKTDHQYFNLVQDCEECRSHSAQWRCDDCKQVYCNKCLTALHSMGGPFSKHHSVKLPYYSEEMHKSFLDDQRTQVFKHRMQEVNRIWSIRNEQTRQKSVVQVQSWWRMVRGAREGHNHILAKRKAIRRAWRLRQKEMTIRNSLMHQALTLLGAAPHLHSDTIEEDILREISIFGKQFAREYIWRNKSDWGHYKIGEGKEARFLQKGVPKTGFDVGSMDELKKQARCGGYRMPGYVLVKQGDSQLKTTCNLKPVLKPGMLVKCGPGYFKVRAVQEDSIVFDRVWRFAVPLPKEEQDRQRNDRDPNRELPKNFGQHGSDNYVGREVLYRLPVFADEPRRMTYKMYYILSNYIVSNPISQVYFTFHTRLFALLGDAAERIQNIHRHLGFKRGAKGWGVTAAIQNGRAKWAADMLNGEDDIEDLGEVTASGKAAKKRKPAGKKIAPEKSSTKKKGKKGKGVRPVEEAAETEEERLAREAEEEEKALEAFMGDKVDLDDIDMDATANGSRPVTREEGERWIATDEEVEARLKLEALMTPEELASHADEWSEHVDPMTENVFWVHDETDEMSMAMPASLRTRNRLNEEREKTESLHRAALEKMNKDKGKAKAKGMRKR